MFDEVERVHYETLELIRDPHDQTGCPVLLCGKPKIFAKLGLRQIGDFSEVTDPLSSRIIMHRDLTLRTRGKKPQPLFSLDDIRKLIHRADVKLHVAPDAVKWLQMRASTPSPLRTRLGTGGLGRAPACFYLACKVAFVQDADTITAQNLEDVADMTMGHEDARRKS
jgi:hypothetical protein